MTVRSLLQTIDVMEQASRAKYPDGSGGKDEYTIVVHMEGHGKVLSAQVEQIDIARRTLFLSARGQR